MNHGGEDRFRRQKPSSLALDQSDCPLLTLNALRKNRDSLFASGLHAACGVAEEVVGLPQGQMPILAPLG